MQLTRSETCSREKCSANRKARNPPFNDVSCAHDLQSLNGGLFTLRYELHFFIPSTAAIFLILFSTWLVLVGWGLLGLLGGWRVCPLLLRPVWPAWAPSCRLIRGLSRRLEARLVGLGPVSPAVSAARGSSHQVGRKVSISFRPSAKTHEELNFAASFLELLLRPFTKTTRRAGLVGFVFGAFA